MKGNWEIDRIYHMFDSDFQTGWKNRSRTIIMLIRKRKEPSGVSFIYRTPKTNLIHSFIRMLFYHALGARLGRFRNYVTAQPMQVTISSVLVFPVFCFFIQYGVLDEISKRRFLRQWYRWRVVIYRMENDKRARRRNNHLGKIIFPVCKRK